MATANKTTLLLLLLIGQGAVNANEVDVDAAQALAKEGNCFKCHSIAKRKSAPSYQEIAKKYVGQADAEKKLVHHLTHRPVVRFDDEDEPHYEAPTKDMQKLGNLVRWILTR